MKPLYLLVLAAILSQVLRPSRSRAEDPLWKGKTEPSWKQANPSTPPAEPLWNASAKITESKVTWSSRSTVQDVQWTAQSPRGGVVPAWKQAPAQSEISKEGHSRREVTIVFPTEESAPRSTPHAPEPSLPQSSGSLNLPRKP